MKTVVHTGNTNNDYNSNTNNDNNGNRNIAATKITTIMLIDQIPQHALRAHIRDYVYDYVKYCYIYSCL